MIVNIILNHFIIKTELCSQSVDFPGFITWEIIRQLKNTKDSGELEQKKIKVNLIGIEINYIDFIKIGKMPASSLVK